MIDVADTVTGEVRQCVNPFGRPAATVNDTRAFASCPEAVSEVPVISNLVLGGPVLVPGRGIGPPIQIDFANGDGDILFTGGFTGTALLRVVLTSGGRTCTVEGTGNALDHPGKTSGTINATVLFPTGTFGSGTLAVSLIDAAGHRSNTLTRSYPLACG